MKDQQLNRIDIVGRRGFLGTVFSAGALVLGAPLLSSPSAFGAEVNPAKGVWYPTVYLGVQPDGTVIIVAHRSEMGTGIRTSLPMVAADELDVEWSKVRVEQALGRQEVRFAGYGRLKLHTEFLRSAANRRSYGARHADRRCCLQVGRPGQRM